MAAYECEFCQAVFGEMRAVEGHYARCVERKRIELAEAEEPLPLSNRRPRGGRPPAGHNRPPSPMQGVYIQVEPMIDDDEEEEGDGNGAPSQENDSQAGSPPPTPPGAHVPKPYRYTRVFNAERVLPEPANPAKRTIKRNPPLLWARREVADAEMDANTRRHLDFYRRTGVNADDFFTYLLEGDPTMVERFPNVAAFKALANAEPKSIIKTHTFEIESPVPGEGPREYQMSYIRIPAFMQEAIYRLDPAVVRKCTLFEHKVNDDGHRVRDSFHTSSEFEYLQARDGNGVPHAGVIFYYDSTPIGSQSLTVVMGRMTMGGEIFIIALIIGPKIPDETEKQPSYKPKLINGVFEILFDDFEPFIDGAACHLRDDSPFEFLPCFFTFVADQLAQKPLMRLYSNFSSTRRPAIVDLTELGQLGDIRPDDARVIDDVRIGPAKLRNPPIEYQTGTGKTGADRKRHFQEDLSMHDQPCATENEVARAVGLVMPAVVFPCDNLHGTRVDGFPEKAIDAIPDYLQQTVDALHKCIDEQLAELDAEEQRAAQSKRPAAAAAVKRRTERRQWLMALRAKYTVPECMKRLNANYANFHHFPGAKMYGFPHKPLFKWVKGKYQLISFGRDTNNWMFLTMAMPFLLDDVLPNEEEWSELRFPRNRRDGGGSQEELEDIFFAEVDWMHLMSEESMTDEAIVALENTGLRMRRLAAAAFENTSINFATSKIQAIGYQAMYTRRLGPLIGSNGLDTKPYEAKLKLAKEAASHTNQRDDNGEQFLLRIAMETYTHVTKPAHIAFPALPKANPRAARVQRLLQERQRGEFWSQEDDHGWLTREAFATWMTKNANILHAEITFQLLYEELRTFFTQEFPIPSSVDDQVNAARDLKTRLDAMEKGEPGYKELHRQTRAAAQAARDAVAAAKAQQRQDIDTVLKWGKIRYHKSMEIAAPIEVNHVRVGHIAQTVVADGSWQKAQAHGISRNVRRFDEAVCRYDTDDDGSVKRAPAQVMMFFEVKRNTTVTHQHNSQTYPLCLLRWYKTPEPHPRQPRKLITYFDAYGVIGVRAITRLTHLVESRPDSGKWYVNDNFPQRLLGGLSRVAMNGGLANTWDDEEAASEEEQGDDDESILDEEDLEMQEMED